MKRIIFCILFCLSLIGCGESKEEKLARMDKIVEEKGLLGIENFKQEDKDMYMEHLLEQQKLEIADVILKQREVEIQNSIARSNALEEEQVENTSYTDLDFKHITENFYMEDLYSFNMSEGKQAKLNDYMYNYIPNYYMSHIIEEWGLRWTNNDKKYVTTIWGLVGALSKEFEVDRDKFFYLFYYDEDLKTIQLGVMYDQKLDDPVEVLTVHDIEYMESSRGADYVEMENSYKSSFHGQWTTFSQDVIDILEIMENDPEDYYSY